MSAITARIDAFCARFGLLRPILLGPMAGVPAPALSIAVANEGGLGSCGVLLMKPEEITGWADTVRAGTAGKFNLNLWIPDPPPFRDGAQETRIRDFLGSWGPVVPESAGDATPPDFASQCDAMLAARPAIISSVMGLYPPDFVAAMKRAGIVWCANISTVAEARAAEAAGADIVAAQGMEAGGHRGCFDGSLAERELVGLFALLPAVVDAVRVPVVATGGIADARGIAAAFLLGASAVQIGTGYLRCPEAGIPTAWADALGRTPPEGTMLTRAFSGRLGRSIATDYAQAAAAADAPKPAPYPVQRALTAAMRAEGAKQNELAKIQAWAGQSAALARPEPAGALTRRLWEEARALLG